MPRENRGGRPPKDAALVADGLALVAGGLSPEEAAERLTAAGRSISKRTLYRALTASVVPRDVKPPNVPAPPVAPSPVALPPEPLPVARALPPAKLGELRDLVARLPFSQQDAIVSTLPFERIRTEALARGLAPYHDAAAAVVRELRAVSL